MSDDHTELDATDLVNETMDALSNARGRTLFLLSTVERGRVDAIGLAAELQAILNELSAAAEHFRTLHAAPATRRLDPAIALIIDDDATYARSLRRRLETIGVKAFHESDPRQGGRTFSVLRPQTVFIDVMMPERRGTLVAAEIKELEPSATVVLVTGLLSVENAFDGGTWGADCIVEKGDVEPLLRIARGEMPEGRVVLASEFATDEELRNRHARRAMERFGSYVEAAEALGIDVRTLKKRLDPEDPA